MDDLDDAPTEVYRDGIDGTGGALEATGVYETTAGIVLYDTEEPLAWVQADNAVLLDEMV